MARLIEMGEAQAAAGQSDRRASAGFAEGDMCPANADGGRDAAFAEVQPDPGEDFDRAADDAERRTPEGAAPSLSEGLGMKCRINENPWRDCPRISVDIGKPWQ